MSISVMMYHAVLRNLAETAGADPYYAVCATDFAAQLATLKHRGYTGASVAELMAQRREHQGLMVGLTFDDGHISNYEIAAPMLSDAEMTADFFINPSTVGKPGFIPWTGLRSMVEAGMSIQSHGYSHCYFDELSVTDVREQLDRSKQEIEDHLGTEVTLFAPPGGRLNSQVIAIAQELGYTGICSSRPGSWSGTGFLVPRMAILASTSNMRFTKWARASPIELLRSQTRYHVMHILKKTLGNTTYERVRNYLLTRFS